MKLNNKGWGFRMMLFLMSVLCIFLAIAIYYIYIYYTAIEKSFGYIEVISRGIL